MKNEHGFGNIELEAILAPYNPWWKNAQFETFSFKRPVFLKIYKDLFSLKQIISITGPRRVGKTTLLKQVIKDLIIVNRIEPAQIIYFSFDDPLMVDMHIRERFFDDLIRWADTKLKDKTAYFFLDEIQRFEKWELYLKKYYDLGFPCRFIISGSASSPIFKKSRESLMGRIKENHLSPFSFKEFVYFQKGSDKEVLDFVNSAHEFGHNLQLEALIHWKETVPNKLDVHPRVMKELDKLLGRYFVEGGFPEAWEIHDLLARQAYLFDNQIQKVIFEDLVIATEFRKPENIKRFYLSLIEQPGQEVNLEKASMRIGVSRTMLEKYLPLLEMTDLVKSLPKFSKRPLKFRRGSVKCYLIDLALRNAILKLDYKILEDKEMLGYYAENLAFNALRGFEGVIELSFYKEQNREVDFIINLGGKRYLPIEIKYRDSLDDIGSIKYFIEKYDQKFGIVVTKNFEQNREENKLLFIPLSVFLLFF
ncbi:MAG: ATP-binding protein [Candidatus Omnitrophica bacterium]|nr:ATP-binding protein [Candidatus Omnitrophota bacterium]MBU4479531.1 ATP-binding protein [Candidatus Omnitrophota bacterium]